MSVKKFSPKDVLKILRACNDLALPVDERCAGCPDVFPNCIDRHADLLAADTIEALLERRQMDADLMQEQKERIVELEEKLEAQRWIPVTERLPDKPGHYLVLSKNRNHSVQTFLVYDETRKEFIHIENGTITHWMPLPEAPEQEGV